MPTVGAAGTRFYYEEVGSGPPLVLVHGTGGSTAMLAASARLLATDRRVVTYDRRGCGRTGGEPPRKKEHLRVHGDDLASVMHELGAMPATVVGWSWGGIVAIAAALRHPDAVSALVLYEPPLHLAKHPTISAVRAIGGAIALGKVGAHRRGAERFARWALARKDRRSGFDDAGAEVREALLAEARSVVAELAAGTGEELTDAELAEVRCPVLLVRSTLARDELTRPIDRLSRSLPRARVVSLADADHLAVVTRPEAFAGAVREALA